MLLPADNTQTKNQPAAVTHSAHPPASSAALQPCRNPGEPDRFPPSNFLSTPAAFFGSEFLVLVCGSDGWFPRNATFWFAPGRVCRVLCAVLCALLSRPADPRTRGLVAMWREIENAANSYLLRHVVPTLLCLGACRYVRRDLVRYKATYHRSGATVTQRASGSWSRESRATPWPPR